MANNVLDWLNTQEVKAHWTKVNYRHDAVSKKKHWHILIYDDDDDDDMGIND